MPDKPWKVTERRVSKKLGGVRNPLSGRSSRHTGGDVIHDKLYIECKHGRHVPPIKLMHQVEKNAAMERKIPVLALHHFGDRHDYFLIRDDHLAIVAKEIKHPQRRLSR
ncbi:MAG: hypothetical protein KAV87_68500 [Desulfobacteraceae bacterium]|nr:hypothetical protein [Desulfobacteraceae bacterium]